MKNSIYCRILLFLSLTTGVALQPVFGMQKASRAIFNTWSRYKNFSQKNPLLTAAGTISVLSATYFGLKYGNRYLTNRYNKNLRQHFLDRQHYTAEKVKALDNFKKFYQLDKLIMWNSAVTTSDIFNKIHPDANKLSPVELKEHIDYFGALAQDVQANKDAVNNQDIALKNHPLSIQSAELVYKMHIKTLGTLEKSIQEKQQEENKQTTNLHLQTKVDVKKNTSNAKTNKSKDEEPKAFYESVINKMNEEQKEDLLKTFEAQSTEQKNSKEIEPKIETKQPVLNSLDRTIIKKKKKKKKKNVVVANNQLDLKSDATAKHKFDLPNFVPQIDLKPLDLTNSYVVLKQPTMNDYIKSERLAWKLHNHFTEPTKNSSTKVVTKNKPLLIMPAEKITTAIVNNKTQEEPEKEIVSVVNSVVKNIEKTVKEKTEQLNPKKQQKIKNAQELEKTLNFINGGGTKNNKTKNNKKNN